MAVNLRFRWSAWWVDLEMKTHGPHRISDEYNLLLEQNQKLLDAIETLQREKFYTEEALTNVLMDIRKSAVPGTSIEEWNFRKWMGAEEQLARIVSFLRGGRV